VLKKIYGEGVIDILPLSKGVIMVTRENDVDDKVIVSYKFYSFESGKIARATRSVYLHAKFGQNFEKYHKIMPDFINYRCTPLPDNRLFTVYPTGEAKIFNGSADLIWEGKINYKEFGPSDVVCVGKSLWIAFPDGDTILRYNLRTMRDELRIGSKKDNAFSRPCGLYAIDNKLVVCNSVSNCIEIVDTDTYVVERYASFDEPVYQYFKIGANEVVLLKSGAYIM
jgi:hypothetical protein